MNTKNTENPENALARFFSPKTVEERFLLGKFTSDMVKEVYEFMPFFTEEDTRKILSCTSPTNCLYMVADTISRIRSERSVSGVSPVCIEETRERTQGILSEK